MNPIRWWWRTPVRFRTLTGVFGVLDLIAAATAVVGWRSWNHALMATAESVLWLILLYPLSKPLLTRSFSPGTLRSQGLYRLSFGLFLLFIAGWAILGLIDISMNGAYPEYALEGNAFVVAITLMGGMLVERGRKMRHPSQDLATA